MSKSLGQLSDVTWVIRCLGSMLRSKSDLGVVSAPHPVPGDHEL